MTDRAKPMPTVLAALLAASVLAAHAQGASAPLTPDAPAAASQPVASPSRAAIRVEVLDADLVADGRSRIRLRVTLAPRLAVQHPTVRVATTGGQLIDADGQPFTGGQRAVEARSEVVEFELQAPSTPGPVNVRIEAGTARADGVLDFSPELRDLIATGVVEAVIGRRSGSAGTVRPVDLNDSAEQEIRRWSRQFGDGGLLAARTAFFVKGHVSGQTLLTMAYDSDKDVQRKLSAVVDPNAVYEVYGDRSVVGFEAPSSDRLFVRLDHGRSVLLYGDFGTASGSMPLLPAGSASAPAERVVLARYARQATGLKGHLEEGRVTVDGFLVDDSLKQVVEEVPANGTSGPFAVRNTNAVQNSERVEIVVRDRQQRGVVRSVTPLVRLVDYSFEPFSGRILLNTPVPSLTPAGDPVSVRITYEVDQGGDRFLVGGLQVSGSPTDALVLGATVVEDHNPLAPYQLLGAQVEARPASGWRVVAETAQTRSTLYTANGQVYALPSGLAGETGAEAEGRAHRVDVDFKGRDAALRLWWLRADPAFNNPGSGLVAGRQDTGLQARQAIGERSSVYAEHHRTEDLLTQLGRESTRVGATHQWSPALKLDASLGVLHDNAGLPVETLIGGSPVAGGGFFGATGPGMVIDPLTGAPINTLAPVGTTPAPAVSQPLAAHTARLAATWTPSATTTLGAEAEADVDGESRRRAALTASHALNDNERVYARAEVQDGLGTASSIDSASHSRVFTAGLVHGLGRDTQLFSEYRLLGARDATGTTSADQLLAAGLRHTTSLSEGLVATSFVEHLHVLQGAQRQAFALGTGVDYSASPDWKANARLEHRRVSDDPAAPGDQRQDQLLATVSAARRLDADWTALLKDYWLLQHNHDDATGTRVADARQQRLLLGLAWRPRAHNRFNALARYEYKSVADAAATGDHYRAHIVAGVMDVEPRRGLWATGRLAGKRRVDEIPGAGAQGFTAWLASGRVAVEVGDKMEVGLGLGRLWQDAGAAHQDSAGLEAGYNVARNTWVSVGYNWTGFTDRDLAAADYTQRGVYLRLRAKFDESLWTAR